jgi:hypothetical protein
MADTLTMKAKKITKLSKVKLSQLGFIGFHHGWGRQGTER